MVESGRYYKWPLTTGHWSLVSEQPGQLFFAEIEIDAADGVADVVDRVDHLGQRFVQAAAHQVVDGHQMEPFDQAVQEFVGVVTGFAFFSAGDLA